MSPQVGLTRHLTRRFRRKQTSPNDARSRGGCLSQVGAVINGDARSQVRSDSQVSLAGLICGPAWFSFSRSAVS